MAMSLNRELRQAEKEQGITLGIWSQSCASNPRLGM